MGVSIHWGSTNLEPNSLFLEIRDPQQGTSSFFLEALPFGFIKCTAKLWNRHAILGEGFSLQGIESEHPSPRNGRVFLSMAALSDGACHLFSANGLRLRPVYCRLTPEE